MRRRPRLAQFSSLTLATGALLAPGVALAASSGGTGFGSGASGGTSTGSGAPAAQPTAGTVRASGNGITIVSRPAALLRRRLTFSGVVAGGSGHVIEIERRSSAGGSWLATTHGTAGRGGAFSATWPTTSTGRFAVRAVVLGPSGAASRASAAPASPSVTVTVYQPAIATTYGPGFWGSQTACGEILHHATLGVANRTLPCGTKVSLYYGGRTIVVPVIDRGPYANHADWDLTSATASALGIDGTVTLGAVRVAH